MTTIRRFEPGDRQRWGELWQGYLTFYEASVPEATTEVTWQRLLTPDEDPNGFAAVDAAGDLVGIVHYHFHRTCWHVDDKCYLQDLFVDPDHRGGGVGRALIEAVYGAARDAGASEVYWMTQHFNETARRLYDDIGELTPFIKYRWK